MSDNAVKTVDEVKVNLSDVPKFNVIILNDNVTPMQFVVSVLIEIFNHNKESAVDVMLKVHNNGEGVAGLYSYEVAEQKASEARIAAINSKFPLQFRIDRI